MKEEKKIYTRLVAKFKTLVENLEGLRSIRSLIEDTFKLAKKACNMENLHRYTMRSVKKYHSLAVFLTGVINAFSINDKKALQSFVESQEKMLQNGYQSRLNNEKCPFPLLAKTRKKQKFKFNNIACPDILTLGLKGHDKTRFYNFSYSIDFRKVL